MRDANPDPPPTRPVFVPIALGVAVPLLIQAALIVLSRGDTPWWTMPVSAVWGFVLMTRRCTTLERLAITLGYFPVMFGILFLETFDLGCRLFPCADNF